MTGRNNRLGGRPLLRALLLASGIGVVAPGCQTNVHTAMESAADLLYREKYVEAERLYRKLLKRLENQRELDEEGEERMLQVLDRLGKINALYLHDYDQALADYDVLVRRFPKTDQAFAARAMAADIQKNKLGNIKAAVDQYQRLVSEFSSKPEARRPQLKIAAAYFQLKDFEQARVEAETLIRRWPDSNEATLARVQIANSYYVQGRYAEAIATYELVLQTKLEPPTHARVLFELGNCFQELGEPDRALSYYYESLANHPSPHLVQRKLKRVRSRLSKTRPAAQIHNSRRTRHVATSRPSEPPQPTARTAPKKEPKQPREPSGAEAADPGKAGDAPIAVPREAVPKTEPEPEQSNPKAAPSAPTTPDSPEEVGAPSAESPADSVEQSTP